MVKEPKSFKKKLSPWEHLQGKTVSNRCYYCFPITKKCLQREGKAENLGPAQQPRSVSQFDNAVSWYPLPPLTWGTILPWLNSTWLCQRPSQSVSARCFDILFCLFIRHFSLILFLLWLAIYLINSVIQNQKDDYKTEKKQQQEAEAGHKSKSGNSIQASMGGHAFNSRGSWICEFI